MEGVDTKMMVHIGTELLLIGGLGFWMKKRVDTLDLQVEELNKKLSVYENIISQQQQMLASHESVLRQAFGIPQLPAGNGFSTPGSKIVSKPKGDLKSSSSIPEPKTVKESEPENVSNVQQDAEDDVSPEDLDEILRQELGEQTNTLEIDTVEISQQEETLKPKKKLVANRKKKTT